MRASRPRPAAARRRGAVGVLVAFALLLSGCTQARSGTPVPGPTTPDPVSELGRAGEANLRERFTEDQQVVNDYWSSERLAAAKPHQPKGRVGPAPSDEPIDSMIVPPSRASGKEVDLSEAIEHPVGAADDGRVWSRVGLSDATVGRLYASVDGEPFVCSAAVVTSSSRALLATAAHCVWDTRGERGYARNVMFVPGNDAGRAPHGRWFLDRAYVPSSFRETAREGDLGVTGDGWAYDVAFLRMQPLDGQDIQDAVGAQGIAFGARPDAMVVLGYPALAPFDGKTMRYCSAPRWTAGQNDEYTLGCSMTPGFSGGPWFTRFDNRLGAGYVVSVTSTTDERVAGGAQLSRVARDLYQRADARN